MTEAAPAPSDASTVLLCPQCGASSPADARLCRRCFASLADAVSAAAEPAKAGRRFELSLPSTTRGWAGLVVAILFVLVGGWWIQGWLSGPPSPFPEVSGDRAVAAPGLGWSTVGGGLDGTRRTGVEPALAGSEGWTWAASSPPSTSLVSDGDGLYVGLEEGVLVALSAGDGTERWRADVPGVLESAPAIAGDRLYAGYRSGSVAAIAAADGATIWETQLGVSISTTPVVVDGLLFVAGNGVIGGFDAEDGMLIWRREIDDSLVPVTPVVDHETLVVATFDRVLIFDRANGELLSWAKLAPQHAPIASVAIDEGVIFVTADQQLLAIATSMRRPWWDGVRPAWEFFHVVGAAPDPPWRPDLWTTTLPADAWPAAIEGDRVILASADGALRAYSRADGTEIWKVELPSITAPPVATASGVFVASEGRSWIVDVGDGHVIAEGAVSDAPLHVVPIESGVFVTSVAGVEGLLSLEASGDE